MKRQPSSAGSSESTGLKTRRAPFTRKACAGGGSAKVLPQRVAKDESARTCAYGALVHGHGATVRRARRQSKSWRNVPVAYSLPSSSFCVQSVRLSRSSCIISVESL
uniref:Uncharacterized protein n=1 Tax=Chrysotila carterae TaxID=13221 RepID=A0A7S4F889_CHRCT